MEEGTSMNKQTVENDPLKTQILEQLKKVIDPELGIDVVNLGLIYAINLFEDDFCEIQVTLTTMHCPFGDVIEDDIKRVVNNIPEIKESTVKFVWYPAWNPSRMTRYAQIALGMQE
jgi:metal-sulfur cluster biosynthetic enzyme